MLYQKRINKIIGDIDKFFDTIDQALLIFGEGVKNYLYTNVEAFKGNLQTMTRLENEANSFAGRSRPDFTGSQVL